LRVQPRSNFIVHISEIVVTKKDFQDAFQKLQKRWDGRVRSKADCFEGDGLE
jgi:hypothetical protein